MKKAFNQDCPLCGGHAVFYFVDYDERKYFKCPICTKFLITRRAEDKISEAPEQWRLNLSNQSVKAPENSVLDISIPSPAHQAGTPSPAILAEYVPKDNLRL